MKSLRALLFVLALSGAGGCGTKAAPPSEADGQSVAGSPESPAPSAGPSAAEATADADAEPSAAEKPSDPPVGHEPADEQSPTVADTSAASAASDDQRPAEQSPPTAVSRSRPPLPWSWDELGDAEQIERRLYEDARYLASDQLFGRGISTPGIDMAADYIAERYRLAGLRTDMYGGTPFHPFNYGTRTVADNQRLEFSRGDRTWALSEDEFTAFRRCSTDPFADLPVVFVGYGITAPEAGYDDYRGVDARGKAVLMLRHQPRRERAEGGLPRDRGDDKPSSHAYIDAKIANALAHGARAVLLCTDLAEVEKRVAEAGEPLPPEVSDRLIQFSVRRGSDDHPPVFHCRRSAVDRLLAAAGRPPLAELEGEIDQQWAPQSFALEDFTVSGDLTIRRRPRRLKNVLGVLEGEGPLRDETIVVGAHYDHLGLGGAGSLARWTVLVHNGADDNASGTSAMIEVARQLSARAPLRRRVLFIAFSAEESGLVGSERYVRTPYVPMEQTVAMLNLDMVGRLGREMEVHGTGTAKEFRPLLAQLAPKHSLRVRPYDDGYGPSDHASFHERGVPVLHFFTGLHRDYHRPSDDYDKLNLAGMRQITMLTTDIALAIAQADAAPQRTASGDDLLGLGGLSGIGSEIAPARRYKLGGRVADIDGRVQMTQVPPRTPAWQAGLRKGDQILACDGQPIERWQQFVELIAEKPVGTQISIRIRRGEVELELDVRLGGGEP